MDRYGNHGVIVCNLLDANALDGLAVQVEALLTTQGCKVSLLKVIESFPSQYYQIPSIQSVWEQWYDEAESELAGVAAHLNIPREDCWLAQGNLHRQIEKFMSSHRANFMIEDGNHHHLPHWFAKLCHHQQTKPPMVA